MNGGVLPKLACKTMIGSLVSRYLGCGIVIIGEFGICWLDAHKLSPASKTVCPSFELFLN